MGTNAVNKGPVAEAVAANVRAVREARGLSQQQLAGGVAELGRPMQATTIAKIEGGDRRVDVDDLVALALALNVSPARLLVGDQPQDEEVRLAADVSVPAWRAWHWAVADHSLYLPTDDLSDADHARYEFRWADEQPLWVRRRNDNDLYKAGRRLTERIERAVDQLATTGAKGHSAELVALISKQVRVAIGAVERELDLAAEEATRG